MSKRPSVMSLDDLMAPKVEPPPPAPVEPSAPPPAPMPNPSAEPAAVPEPVEAAEEAPRKGGRRPVPEVFRTSLYFHRAVHDALREIAYDERLTISDLINEGIDQVLKGRGYPSASELKTKGARKRKR